MAFFFYTSWNLADVFRSQLIKRGALLILFFYILLSSGYSCNVICRVNLNLSIGANGYSVVTPGLLLVDNSCDPTNFKVELINGYGSNLGDTIKCHNIGETLTAKVIRLSDNNFCTTMITVFDNFSPMISCSDTTILCGNDKSPAALGYPTVYDNCTSLTINDMSFVDVPVNYSCGFIDNGDTLNALIERRWTVLDSVGNQGFCTQFIRLKKSYLSDVQLPPNHDGTQLPAIDCQVDPSDLSITGYPNINGLALNTTNFCDLAADYSDQELNICGAGYLILRTWTMADWCTGDVESHVQFIKVADTIAPTFICPQDFTVSTSVNSCFATVQLPTTMATDDCSAVEINPVWEFGTGYGPFQNIPLGTYPVTYSATDACGNSSTCVITITVEDHIPPQVICKQFLQVSLGFNGQAFLPATSLDAGTYDNCILDNLLISRDGINFEPSVLLDCEDIENNPITVAMRAYDYFGNHNECDVQVTLLDILPPSIVCPEDITISCSQDILNINITGIPTYIDNCFSDTMYFNDSLYLNNCNVGYLDRYWTVRDAMGLESFCTQRIELVDSTILNITFPTNFQTNICDPDLSPTITGEPIFTNRDCEFISMTFNDDTLSQVVPSCFVVYRNWEVINWCTYDAITGEGFYESVQVISVTDDQDPVLSVPNDTIINSYANDCGLTFVALNVASAVDCSEFVSINNQSVYASNSGADASGFYPMGVHQIVFSAMDNCGNNVQKSFQITVVDNKNPTAVCRNGLIFTIDSNGSLILNPEDLNLSSFDNCTPNSLLQFSLSQNEFSCDDIGSQLVVLFVYDLEGNVGSCSTTITIQNQNGICQDASISGHVSLWSNGDIRNASLELSGVNDGQTNSDANGFYQFDNLVPGQNYLIEAFKDGSDGDGISVLDIVILARHIVGLSTLSNPYQIIAGDIDLDNSVSAFDLIQMQKLILLVDTINPNGDSWRFIPDDFVFTNPSNPFLDALPNFHEINNLPMGATEKGFLGIKLGDVSGNANPQLNSSTSIVIQENNSRVFDFFPNKKTESFGFHLVLNTAKGLDGINLVPNSPSNFNFDYYYDSNLGEIRIVAHSLTGRPIDPSEKLFSIEQIGGKANKRLKVKKCQVISSESILSAKSISMRSN